MEKCQKGYICFNREIFLIVGVIIIGLAIYGFNNKDTLYIRKPTNNEDQQLEERLSFRTDYDQNKNQNQNQYQNQYQNQNQTRCLNQYPNQIQNQIPNQNRPNETVNNYNYRYEVIHEDNNVHQRELVNIRDPLHGPERQHPYLVKEVTPINIPTRGYVSEYQQLGALYSVSGTDNKPRVLPLYGKPTYPGSHKWLYYTSTDDYNTVKVPVSKEGKRCGGDFGCPEFDGGDLVNVSPYGCKFRVELYDIDRPRYLPNIIY